MDWYQPRGLFADSRGDEPAHETETAEHAPNAVRQWGTMNVNRSKAVRQRGRVGGEIPRPVLTAI